MSEIKLVIIPDPEEADAAEIYVDGDLAGREVRFLLDTGAAGSAIAYDEFSATFESSEQSHSSGVFAAHSQDKITIPEIHLGPISKENYTLVRESQDVTNTRSLIGMTLLKDSRFHFLFNESKVLVEPEPVPATLLRDLLMDARFHPYVEIGFGEIEAKAVWDTGAGITIVDQNFINKYPALFEEVGEGMGTDSTGTQMLTQSFMMAETVIGGHAFPKLKVAGVDLGQVNATIEIPMDLILGYNALIKADWYFDFPGKKWAITKFF